MGLFSNWYTKPGPGVAPDAPRKRGMSRLMEILGRDLGSFFKAGLLAGVSALPFVVGVTFSVLTHSVLVLLFAAVIGGMIAAPQLTGMADTVLRSLRDEPGFWWHTYRRAWKGNARASLLPGAVLGLVFGGEIFMAFHLVDAQPDTALVVMLIAGIVLAVGVSTYLWPQIALLDLPFPTLLKNAMFLFLAYLPASLGALVVQLVYWAAVILLFPLSLPVFLLLTNFWLPMVPSLLIVYQGLDRSFSIEESLNKRRDLDNPG